MSGDGLAEVVVGAPYAESNAPYAGRTYVVFGKADTDEVELADVAKGIGGFALDGEDMSGRSGSSVSGTADVNGDSVPDIIVGAPTATPGGTRTGRTYVIFGGDFSCSGR
jgi:hypothetical protein